MIIQCYARNTVLNTRNGQKPVLTLNNALVWFSILYVYVFNNVLS